MEEATVTALEELARTAADLRPDLRDRILTQFMRSMEQHGCSPETVTPYADLVRRRIAELASERRVTH